MLHDVAVIDAGSDDLRGRRNPWWAITAVVVVALGIAIAYLLTRPDHSADAPAAIGPSTIAPVSVPLPTPSMISQGGHTYYIGLTAPSGAQLDGHNPNRVLIYASDTGKSSDDPICTTLQPSVRVVRETSTQVIVATFAYQAHVDRHGMYGCAFVTGPRHPLYATLSLQLRQPLGNRGLEDAKTGKAIGLIGGLAPPTPRYVPAGYQQSLAQSANPGSDLLAIRQYRNGDHDLEIHVRSQTAWSLDGKILARTIVNGHPATVSDSKYDRCVTWFPDRGLVDEVCSYDKSAAPSTDELLRVARSIP